MSAVESLEAALRRGRNTDGGWGYYAGKASRLEPTCWALLALADSDPEVLRKWPSVNGLLLERTGGEPNYAFHALGLLTLIGRRAEYTLGNGRLLVAGISLLISVPLIYFALGMPIGAMTGFTILMFAGCAAMYVYYSTVYSTIQDVIEPSLRGTAMALYFFAMYVLGASLGPVGMGFLSGHFTEKAAVAAGVTETTFEALRPFAPQGLHSALYVIPVLGFLLSLVLFAGSRTVTKDMERLQRWMRESSDQPSGVEAAKVEAAK